MNFKFNKKYKHTIDSHKVVNITWLLQYELGTCILFNHKIPIISSQNIHITKCTINRVVK